MSLEKLITEILDGGNYFLSGINDSSSNLTALLTAIIKWGEKLDRDLNEIISVVEPCVRQSIMMSLIPALALDPNFSGSIDSAIDDHLNQLQLNLPIKERVILRNLCINVRRLQSMSGRQARNSTSSIAQLRMNNRLYLRILNRQKERCLWCGVELLSANVTESLEHIAPKHIGDDPIDGSNWGIACNSCNNGKSDSLAWAAKAEAHDFFCRTDFIIPNEITLLRRWTVLMRTRHCVKCTATFNTKELWVYRRIPTGLPIPVNCSVTCEDCAKQFNLEILLPKWMPDEIGRGKPI